jgi:pimeloyl-ACP methyl ester carboxylesterase
LDAGRAAFLCIARLNDHWAYAPNSDIYDPNPRRIAIGGLSMGGFGAYDLARLNPERFCAVGGDSPALWLNREESAAGAFDNAEDCARHNVTQTAMESPNPYPGARLWIDVGSEDPFKSADRTCPDPSIQDSTSSSIFGPAATKRPIGTAIGGAISASTPVRSRTVEVPQVHR